VLLFWDYFLLHKSWHPPLLRRFSPPRRTHGTFKAVDTAASWPSSRINGLLKHFAPVAQPSSPVLSSDVCFVKVSERAEGRAPWRGSLRRGGGGAPSYTAESHGMFVECAAGVENSTGSFCFGWFRRTRMTAQG
jgi:hypothetical protein